MLRIFLPNLSFGKKSFKFISSTLSLKLKNPKFLFSLRRGVYQSSSLAFTYYPSLRFINATSGKYFVLAWNVL